MGDNHLGLISQEEYLSDQLSKLAWIAFLKFHSNPLDNNKLKQGLAAK